MPLPAARAFWTFYQVGLFYWADRVVLFTYGGGSYLVIFGSDVLEGANPNSLGYSIYGCVDSIGA